MRRVQVLNQSLAQILGLAAGGERHLGLQTLEQGQQQGVLGEDVLGTEPARQILEESGGVVLQQLGGDRQTIAVFLHSIGDLYKFGLIVLANGTHLRNLRQRLALALLHGPPTAGAADRLDSEELAQVQILLFVFVDHVVEVLGHQEAAVRTFRITSRFLQGLHQRLKAFHATSPLHCHAGAQSLGKGVGILIGTANVIHRLTLCFLLLLLQIAHVNALELFVFVVKAAFLGQLGLGGVDLRIHPGHFAHQGLVGLQVFLGEKSLAFL